MNPTDIYPVKLFSYGTLQYEPVQLSLFGRKLDGTQDTLTGYLLTQLIIKDNHVVTMSGAETHPILVHTGVESDKVTGTVFDISSEELQQADQYEVKEYKRVSVQLDSKTHAWVYVSAE